jgi:ribonuclease R
MKITREKILSHIAKTTYQPGKMKELAKTMGVTQADYREFRQLVKGLVREGALMRGRHSRYMQPSTIDQVVGRLKVHIRGFGLLARSGDSSDVFIQARDLGEAMDGDLVGVALTGASSRRGEPLGRVTEIVEQVQGEFLGTYRVRGRRHLVSPDEAGVNRDIFLDGKPSGGVKEGYKVVVRIVERDVGYDGLRGEIIEILGDPDDPKLDFLSLVRRFDLQVDFSDAVQQEAEQARIDLDLTRREDLRGLSCCTIDPDEAKDFDDAISIEKIENGHRVLGVHIADVSHFVQEGTELDKEAKDRATSVYLLDRVIHMLPARIAADICTLAPGEDRLAMSIFIEVDANGALVDYRICESVIHSAGRLTYGQVQSVFDGRLEDAGPAVDFTDDLALMRQLAQQRTKIRLERGALDFAIDQARVVVDEESRPIALGRYPRWESHRLIEEFMLLANECVADFAQRRQLPVLYRVHRPPSSVGLVELGGIVSSLRVELGPDDEVRPKDLQLFLRQIADRKDAPLINKLVLKAMSRAEYTSGNSGHFGLACSSYLHFTSPIRRYPDLWVHRVIKRFIAEEKGNGAIEVEGLLGLGRWTSARERRAEEAERIYIKTKQMRYMEQFVGEQFPGVVSGVLRGGFFVQVGDFMVDGFCLLRDLDDYFIMDEKRHRLVGRRSGRVFELGTPVNVVVADVDWAAREMDLVLVEDGESGKRGKGKGKSKNRSKSKSKSKSKKR